MTWLAWCVLAAAGYVLVLAGWSWWCAWQSRETARAMRDQLDQIRGLPEREPVR